MLSNRALIAAYALIAIATTAAVEAFPIPNQVLMVLLAPVMLAAGRPERYVYAAMLSILTVCVFYETENYRLPITESTITVIASFVTAVVACEAIRAYTRRQARIAARIAESEQRLRTFLECAPDAIFILDERGCVVEANEKAGEAFAPAGRDLIGTRFADLVAGDASSAFDFHKRRHWNGKLCKADGSAITVEASIGQIDLDHATSYMVIARDQDERTRAESQLRQSEAIRQSILESTPDYVMMIDLDYRITFINRTVSDLSVEQVLNQPVFDFIPAERAQNALEVYEQVRNSRLPGMFETNYVSTVDGSESFFESRVAPVIENGEVAGFIVSASDVTERRRQEAARLDLERSLLHAQKLESLGLLAGGIAHDFNNLLVAIMGRADLAREDLQESPENVLEHLQRIVDASEHAANLCKQLLAYSGKGKFFVAPTNWPSLVGESRSLLEISTPDYVNVTYELDDEPKAFDADATQMKQVIVNLLTNAADSLPNGGGRVFVRTGAQQLLDTEVPGLVRGELEEQGEYAFLEVEDTGSGMTAETLERLFDPFYTTKPEGTGLGMAAVLGIVRSHSGAISVRSNEGHGTSIRVLIPLSAAGAPHDSYRKVATEPTRNGGGRILVVDDEAYVRDVARNMLERAQFSVVCADSATEAIEVLKVGGDEIDAVVLDMKMPDMNGEQAMEKFRAIRPDLPILLSTGYSELEISTRLEGKGVAAFLPKPYRASDLVSAISQVLSPSRAR